jgi:hypothetical protein
LTRLGLNCSTVLGTLLTPVIVAGAVWRSPGTAHAEPRQSYGQGLTRPNLRTTGSANWIGRYAGVSYTRPRTFGRAGRPGRSVAASASALGAEDRRFESCRPDTVIASRASETLKIITETRV